jgi:hypothetical protein
MWWTWGSILWGILPGIVGLGVGVGVLLRLRVGWLRGVHLDCEVEGLESVVCRVDRTW